jgi:hypothetical protein
MNYRLLSTINAVLLAVFGVAFFIMPEFALGFFDTETYTATVFLARFFGATLVLAGMFIWMSKDLAGSRAERTLAIMLLVSSVFGFILTLIGMLGADVIRANGWILLVLHILFALGYGYLISGVTITASKRQ